MNSNYKFPVCFFGHGSPMNAVAKNDYTQSLSNFGHSITTKPDCILMISAHWETQGFYYTDSKHPKQIYDMYGFPDELYKLKYSPIGYPQIFDNSPDLKFIQPASQLGTHQWGIDHGTWSVLTHLRPLADIPVVQLSLNRNLGVQEHYELGQKLASLDLEKTWIMGSGNIVHNLRRFSWEEKAPIMDWSASFDQWIHQNIEAKKYDTIVNDWQKHPSAQLAVPSLEHFLPFIVCLGLVDKLKLEPKIIYDGIQNASLAMRSYSFT